MSLRISKTPIMPLTPDRIAQISDFDDLLAFLRDDLSWPVPLDAALEDVSFPYDAAELGLSPAVGALLRDSQIANLQPLTGEQPWGLFFIEFAAPRVSVTALRETLRALVRRHPDRPAYERDDLLFVCATQGFGAFSVVHFQKRDAGAPVLETFGWNRGDAHVRTLCEFNLPALRFKSEFELDADAWRAAWRSAFDVERVTQEFFRAYREVFHAVEDAVAPSISDDEERRGWTQRLFNRLMFLYFLQKKGWLSFEGDSNYLRALFGATQAGENFYASRLDACFFQGLNHFSGAAQNSEALRALRGDVPFLNGGLFERDGAFDGEGAVSVPNAVFERVFGLFEGFNFTIEESTPLDVQVSVDPEMLGKVFEELITGRHETGSYYTPRPVVAFMCREALKGYLAPFDLDGAVARFVDEDDASGLADPDAVLQALKRVRVCDPACGSGAYLLGMMKELLRLRESLFVSHQLDGVSAYRKKLEIIGANLYGVDRDPFAANIAKLRLWLSLVIDFEGTREQIPALPNLGYKIGVGDSLLAPDPLAHNLQAAEYAQLCPRLERLHDEMFARGIRQREGKRVRDKGVIDAEIAGVVGEIKSLFGDSAPHGSFDWRSDFAEVFAPRESPVTQFGTLNLGIQLPDASESGGFDIVLANPPYVRQELIKELKPALKATYGEVYTGVADLYVYFYARALQLLRGGGMLAFISSNKWFRAGYGAKLRAHIAKTTQVLSITDFGDLPVFQEADAYPMIFLAAKHAAPAPQSVTEITRWTLVKSLAPPYPDVREIIAQSGQLLPTEALNGSEWTLADAQTAKRLETMRAAGTPLGEYVKGQIFIGVKTGFNKAFWLTQEERDEIVAKDKGSSALIKPMLLGKDVKRWKTEDSKRWLIFTQRGTNIDDFPGIKSHMKLWKKNLLPKPTDWDDEEKWGGRKGGSYKWHEIQDNVAYHKRFKEPKIVFPDIALEPRFAFDTTGAYPDMTAFVIPTNDLYLLGVLNSSSVENFFLEISAEVRGGYLRFKRQYVEQIPIPNAPASERAAISALVQGCLDARGVDCGALEAEINARVAALYGL